MLQRVNFILMIVVTVMVIGVGAQVWITQRHNTLALQDITTQLAKMRVDAGAEARDRGWSAPGSEPLGAKVLVEGAVDKPGWYDVNLSSEPTLLHELLFSIGVQGPDSLVFYTRSGQSSSLSYDYTDLQLEANKVVLGPGDHIRVKPKLDEEQGPASNRPPTQAGWAELQSGEWRQFDVASWKEVENGAKLLLLDSYDVRNTAGMPGGVMALPNETDEIGVLLSNIDMSPTNLSLYEQSGGKVRRISSRWQLDSHGNLVINVAPLRPGLAKPLTIRRVASADAELDKLSAIVGEMSRNRPWSSAQAPQATNHAQLPPSDELGRQSGFVNLDGDVERAGTYNLPSTGSLDLVRFFRAAGVPDDFEGEVIVARVENGKPVRRNMTMEDLRTTPEVNMKLADGDQIILRAPPPITGARLLESTPEAAPADPLKRSPFRAVKWNEWSPFVDMQGQWYELLAIDTIPIAVLVEQAKRIDETNPRRAFSEDLVQLLQESGRTVGESLRLDVRDIASGTKFAIGEAQLTAENHARVLQSNVEAKDAGNDYPIWMP